MPGTPVPPGADRNFLPSDQALLMLRALTGPFPNIDPGDPGGHLIALGDNGFAAPDFDGADIEIFAYDCAPGGAHDDDDCDNGSAPADRIRMPATRYCASPEDDILRVIGHETFHHTQFAYIDFDNWPEWGRAAVEGSARMMEDQLYGILDDGTGVQRFLGEANNDLATPGQPFWTASYQAARGWKYAAEQFGAVGTESERGNDFLPRFRERAGADEDHADTPRTFEATIGEFAPGKTLESWFQDFSIANPTKHYDATGLPGSSRYEYVDENDGNGTQFDGVAIDGFVGVPGGTTSGTVQTGPWGSAYYRAPVGDCGAGDLAGFRGRDPGSWLGLLDTVGPMRFGVLAIDTAASPERIVDLRRGAAKDFGVAFPLRSEAVGNLALGAVLTSGSSFRTVEWAFACGPGSLDVPLPTAPFRAFVGPAGEARRKFLVFATVTGPPELSAPTVKGLRARDFSVYVGTNGVAEDEAHVLAAVESGDRYVLTVYPRDKPPGSVHDLHVDVGPTISDTNLQAVIYEQRIVDEMIVLDRSGSMSTVTSPEGLPKIDAARNAAGALVDTVDQAGTLGAAAFSDTAILLEALADATPLQRGRVKQAIDDLETGGQTSIGAGLDLAGDELVVEGKPENPDWILLLSDGAENEAPFWAAVEAGIKAAGIRVATFALGQDADFRLMVEIAIETDGVFVPLGDDPSAAAALGAFAGGESVQAGTTSLAGTQSNALADAFVGANDVAEGKERLWETRGTVTGGPAAQIALELEEGGIRDATLVVTWSDPTAGVAVQVTRPDATALTDAVPGVDVFTGTSHAVYHVDALQPGSWTLALTASGPAEYLVSLAGIDEQAATLTVALGGGHDEPLADLLGIRDLLGLPQPITATLTDRTGPIAGAEVRAEVRHPDGTVLDLPLWDDGEHGDGDAGDGVYGNGYTRTTSAAVYPVAGPEGAYGVTVRARGTNALDQDFTRIRRAAFFVGDPGDPAPDGDGDGDGTVCRTATKRSTSASIPRSPTAWGIRTSRACAA